LVVVGNLLFSVNDLLGPGTLFAFAAGRYYEPRIEERALRPCHANVSAHPVVG
jgi:hypothetical protein